ncbi:DUF3667 domain-containing protein [Pseudoxanthomonas beigongshangi]
MSSQTDVLPHDPAPAGCENCATPLQGEFCHRCGQSSHNPLRHAGHAIEEVFESFWHLDGRIFRTLRTLCSPGRLANAYLAGHRAPYVAPLRLFVIVSVLTFFIAQFAVHIGNPSSEAVVQGNFEEVATVAEVERQRDEAIQGLLQGKAAVDNIPGASIGFDRSIKALREQARKRIAELDPKHPSLQQPLEAGEPAATAAPEAAEAPSTAPPDTTAFTPEPSASSAATDKEAKAEPKGFFNRWLKKKAKRAEENWVRFQKDPELFKNAGLKSIPTALFFLVPVFAVFLKIAYLGSGRLYLEHLVVALYSHAWLCLNLLGIFLLLALDEWITPHAAWFAIITGLLQFILWWWMPIYLLLMQKRVYRQAWWLTVLKYLVVGMVYLFLVSFAAMFVLFTSFINA